jgi:hypothetical protein
MLHVCFQYFPESKQHQYIQRTMPGGIESTSSAWRVEGRKCSVKCQIQGSVSTLINPRNYIGEFSLQWLLFMFLVVRFKPMGQAWLLLMIWIVIGTKCRWLNIKFVLRHRHLFLIRGSTELQSHV